jgi:hypothetical protein
MNPAVEWIEQDPESPYNLENPDRRRPSYPMFSLKWDHPEDGTAWRHDPKFDVEYYFREFFETPE